MCWLLSEPDTDRDRAIDRCRSLDRPLVAAARLLGELGGLAAAVSRAQPLEELLGASITRHEWNIGAVHQDKTQIAEASGEIGATNNERSAGYDSPGAVAHRNGVRSFGSDWRKLYLRVAGVCQRAEQDISLSEREGLIGNVCSETSASAAGHDGTSLPRVRAGAPGTAQHSHEKLELERPGASSTDWGPAVCVDRQRVASPSSQVLDFGRLDLG